MDRLAESLFHSLPVWLLVHRNEGFCRYPDTTFRNKRGTNFHVKCKFSACEPSVSKYGGYIQCFRLQEIESLICNLLGFPFQCGSLDLLVVSLPVVWVNLSLQGFNFSRIKVLM